MTATETRPVAAGMPKPQGKPKGSLQAPPRPQVNLLPPEVRAARGLKVVKTWLAAGVVAVIVLLVLAFVLSILSRANAEEELADAQAETARLQAEEKKYAEVPIVLGALDQTQRAKELGMSTDIDWSSYLGALAAVTPEGVAYETVTVATATPTVVPAAPASPLYEQAVGQIIFAATSATVPDTAAWIEALESVPGFADAWVTSARIEGTAESEPFYRIDGNVQVTDDAFSGRYAAQSEEGN